jgi:hypothetical protein
LRYGSVGGNGAETDRKTGTGGELILTDVQVHSQSFYRVLQTAGIPIGPIARFSEATSVARESDNIKEVVISLSQPFTGTLHYEVGGTAIPGLDYQPLSGSVPVAGSTASIPIAILTTPDITVPRSVVLTLREPPGSGLPTDLRLGTPRTHVLTITDGEQGYWTGVATFSDPLALDSQPVAMSVTTEGNRSTAVLNFGRTPWISQQFKTAVSLTSANQIGSIEPVNGKVFSSVLNRDLLWSLQFAPSATTNEVSTVPFTLVIGGLLQNAAPYTIRGALQLKPNGSI